MTGAQFRTHYQTLGYTRYEIAAELGVSGETIRQVCRRKKVPRLYALAMCWLVAYPGLMAATVAVARAKEALAD